MSLSRLFFTFCLSLFVSHLVAATKLNDNDNTFSTSHAAVINAAKKYIGWTHDQIDCSHLVYEAYKAAKFPYPYTTTYNWPPSQFTKVSTPEPGDVLLFEGHMGVYTRPGYFFGSQSSTGPAEAAYGPDKYWGKTKKLLGYYRYK